MANKLLLAAGLFLLVAVVVAQEGYPSGPCDPGSETMYECNKCRCSADGSGYACTRRACPSTGRDRRQAGNTCTPGQSFLSSDGCNTCTCGRDGNRRHAACTLKACLGPRG